MKTTIKEEMQIGVGDKVTYSYNGTTRKGNVIALNEVDNRARIRWDGSHNRTWVRIKALLKQPGC